MDTIKSIFNDRDEFKRKDIAVKVKSLLESDIDISPLVIDGGWGTGKTEFCHKLINLMRCDDAHHLIYIDAFKADNANNPLMTILSEVIKILHDQESKSSFMKKAIPVVRYSFKASAKAVVSHVLKQDFADAVDDFDKEIQKSADKVIDAAVESVLKDHIKAEESLRALQSSLEEKASSKPIMLFVDELDRCRPNFAIDMLELIKHVFDVKGVVFVLVTNTQQLKASVNHCYGHAVDARRYLDKFIKFRFELSPYSNKISNSPILASKKHFVMLAKDRGCLPDSLLSDSQFKEAIDHLIKHRSISLREIETLILHIQIAQTLSHSEFFIERAGPEYALLKLIGVMLVCFEPELLTAIKQNSVDADVLGRFLGVESIPVLGGTIKPAIINVIMIFIAKDCHKNTNKYIPQQEQEQYWNEYMRFKSVVDAFDPGEALNLVIQAVDIISFK